MTLVRITSTSRLLAGPRGHIGRQLARRLGVTEWRWA